jgi:hypothetical protein
MFRLSSVGSSNRLLKWQLLMETLVGNPSNSANPKYNVYGNAEPSSVRNHFEGVETRRRASKAEML